MALLRLIVVALLVGAFGCSTASQVDPSHHVGAAGVPVPQGPATINGHDAGSYPHLALTVPALPGCDGGCYVPADGGMQCGACGSGTSLHAVDGGGLSIVEAGLELFPLCDGGVYGRPPGGGPVACTRRGLTGVMAGTAISVTGSADNPTIAATASTDSVPGTMSAADKTKLDGIGAGADVSSVTGSGSTSCSPTTGAVTCTTVDSLANGLTGADLSGCTTGEIVKVGSSALACESTVPVSAGGTGAAPTCVGGDLVMASSSTAMACVASSGDVSYATGGAATVTSLQAGEITVGSSTGTMTCATGATACGLAESSESASLMLQSGYAILNAPTYDSLRIGNTSEVLISSTYVALTPDATPLAYFNGTTGESVFSYNIGVGVAFAGSGTYGGGTATEYFANGTAPTSACTGGACISSDSAGVKIEPSGASAPVLTVGSSSTSLVSPLGGSSSTPFSFGLTTESVGVGGTLTLSAADCANPIILLTATGTTTSDVVVDFGSHCTTGIFYVAFPGITFGSVYSIDFKNGTSTISYGGAGTNAYNGPLGRMVTVVTETVNHIATSF